MKTINFELSKRLTESGILDNVETEYYIDDVNDVIRSEERIKMGNQKWYKTLTLEEAIDFIPKQIKKDNINLGLNIFCGLNNNGKAFYTIQFKNASHQLYIPVNFFTSTSILEAIEKMIEYLLDNNLLGQKK